MAAMARAAACALAAGCVAAAAPVAGDCSTAAASCAGPADDMGLLQTRQGASLHAVATEPTLSQPTGSVTEPLVHAVYTYGAPATHGEPFRNAASPDGCFPGLRSYTEDIKGAFGEIHQIDAAAMHNYYPHARTPSLVLRWDMDSLYSPCDAESDGHPEWPQRGASVFHEWRLHQEDDYRSRFDSLTIDGQPARDSEPFKTARFFAELAWKSYDSMENTKEVLRERMPGWTLVARADDRHDAGGDDDPVMIVQEEDTMDCALVFTGTNDISEFSTSTTQYGTGYCGFEQVHVGYRNELWTMSDDIFGFLRPTLEQCARVICVGHSLGGALCEIFAACANSGNFTDPDYQKLAWKRATPRRLSEANSTDYSFN